MALYEITLQTEYFGQSCINRWNYELTGSPAAISGSFGLVAGFGGIASGVPSELPVDTVLDELRDLMNTDVKLVAIEAYNVYDAADFYTTPFPVGTTGRNNVGDSLSPVTAYGFRTTRTRRDIRRATKRIVGVPEGAVVDGGQIEAGVLSQMEVAAAAMTATLSYDDEGNVLLYSPVVVKKEKTINATSGKPVYKYYETLAEQELWLAKSIIWEPYSETRTQVSRQYGRGS